MTGVDGEALAGVDAPDPGSLIGRSSPNERVTQLGHADVPKAIAVALKSYHL